MSGGVDSSVSALLLKKQSFEVTGYTFMLWDAPPCPRKCCGGVEIARDVAKVIGIKHEVLDLRDEFAEVVKYFVSEYLRGRTPVPCAICNERIKFDVFLNIAKEQGADFVATGHYAIREGDNLIRLKRSRGKDQTYFLFMLNQTTLKHTLFPVGVFTKEQVRKIAEEHALMNANRPESQDLCFISKDYRVFLKTLGIKAEEGEIVDDEGRVLGRHKGYFNFTVGQRRGLGLPGGPYYVEKIIPEENKIVVTKRKILRTKFKVSGITWVHKLAEEIASKEEVTVKVRHGHKGTPARIMLENSGIEVLLKYPYGPITPGQACVIYLADEVLGGGFIR